MNHLIAFMQRKKLTFLITSIVLIILLIIGGVLIHSITDIDNALSAPRNALGIYMEYQSKDHANYLVFADDIGAYVKPVVQAGEDGTLVVKNKRKTPCTIELVIQKDRSEVYRQTLVFDDHTCRIDLGSFGVGEYDLTMFVTTEDSVCSYVSTEQSFLEALTRNSAANSMILQMTDIDLSAKTDLTIHRGFTWKLNGNTFRTDQNIVFDSNEIGTMKIENTTESDIICKDIFCRTPLWDYSVNVPFSAFAEERTFYVYANRVNDKIIDCSELYLDAQEDLEKVLSPNTNALRTVSSVTDVYFTGDIQIEQLTVTTPLSLHFSGNVTITESLSIVCSDAETIVVDDAENTVDNNRRILVDAPLCKLEWYSDYAPALENVEQYMNVLSFNNTATDAHMGGSGTAALVSGTLTDLSSGNTVPFTPDGYCIDVSMGYIDRINPDTMELSGEYSEEASTEIVKVGSDYYWMVIDKNGNTKGYKVKLNSAEYKLPIVYITTENNKTIDTKDYYINGLFSIDYNGAYDYEDLTDAKMGIQGRGNSSWKLDKKPYKVKFESGTSLFGLEKAKRWVLIANHVDRSLIRNQLAYAIGTVLDNMVFVPHAYAVDLFVNGEYQGVYQLSEQIEINEGRIPGTEDAVEIDTDYLLEIGGDQKETAFGTNYFSHTLFRYLEVKNPDAETISEEQFQYITEYVKSVEDAIMTGGDYESLLDVPSLIDWFLLYEFAYNLDGMFRRSDFLLKPAGDKLYFCTPWDFDYAFGNMSLDSANYQEWISLGNAKTDAYNEYIKTNVMDYLLKDPDFTAQLKARWEEVGDEMLAIALATIGDAEANIYPSANENFTLWDIWGYKMQFESYNTANITTYQGQLDYLKTWINNRYQWMNTTIAAF